MSPDDNMEGVDEDGVWVQTEETGYEDLETNSEKHEDDSDW